MNEALRIARTDQLWTQQIFPLHYVEGSHIYLGVNLQCSRPSVSQNPGEIFTFQLDT
jgi:hypothetical protein